MKLLAWRCRQCRAVTYIEAQDPTGRSLNLPGYCSGCGREWDRKDAEFLGWYETGVKGVHCQRKGEQ